MKTVFEIEIEEDGTVSMTTSDISDQHHVTADDFLSELEDMIGGKKVTKKREHPFWKNKRVLRKGKIVTT